MVQRSNRIDIENGHAALTMYRHNPQIHDEASHQLGYEAKKSFKDTETYLLPRYLNGLYNKIYIACVEFK
jgi:hypothetical protein